MSEYSAKSPDLISEEELRHYFLHLKDERRLARSSITVALCGIKFFYQRTLGQNWGVFDVVRPRRKQKLPVVLSRDEVRQILACIRIPVYRVCLSTIYGCGLRLMEGARLKPGQIDKTTSVYMHLTTEVRRATRNPIERLTEGL